MRDICTKIAASAPLGDLNFVYFVYEMELRKLQQPFFSSNYYLFLFACGEGELRANGKSFRVSPGTLAILRPWQMYEILETNSELTYLYIIFNGSGAESFLSELGIKESVSVYPSHEHLLEFWMKSIRRVQKNNAHLITQAVFMHTLSYLIAEDAEGDDRSMHVIKEYMQENLQNPELSLRMVAGIFFYSEKYFSYLFREKTGIKFTDYLNDLRIRYALQLIGEGKKAVAEISAACGFTHACYFSKVFKKLVGKPPAIYIRARADFPETEPLSRG